MNFQLIRPLAWRPAAILGASSCVWLCPSNPFGVLISLREMTNKKDPPLGESFLLVTHLGGTWNAVIEDLIRLSELLDDEEADNV